MDFVMLPVHWMILFILLLVIELLTMGLTTIWFAAGSLLRRSRSKQAMTTPANFQRVSKSGTEKRPHAIVLTQRRKQNRAAKPKWSSLQNGSMIQYAVVIDN